MRTITLEEHFATPEYLDGPGRRLKERALAPGSPIAKALEKLCDLADGRIADMDAAKIDMQVLSLNSPGVEQLEAAEAVTVAREANEHLSRAIRRYLSRFAGFASLPTAAPDAAALELERCVREYGFKGALINGHARGRYLDDKFFWPILETAVALKVPIYLHPTQPPQAVIDASYSGFDPLVVEMLASSGWGWHIETATHILRMILGGVFDRFPDLQMIIGHMGEGLPFMLQRLDIMPMAVTRLKRPISAYLRENIYYIFGGFNYTPTFLDLFMQVGSERIMFSVDYPYGSMTVARNFLDQLPVSAADRENIAHGNAERLLKM